MADKVAFQLVSPERLLISEQADMVVVPGSEGDFGVLPDHAPVISKVRAGVIEVYEGSQVRDRVFVAGGFAEVTGERCAVLAEEAIPVADIDRAYAERRIRDAEQAIDDAETDTDRAKGETALEVARTMLEFAR